MVNTKYHCHEGLHILHAFKSFACEINIKFKIKIKDIILLKHLCTITAITHTHTHTLQHIYFLVLIVFVIVDLGHSLNRTQSGKHAPSYGLIHSKSE